MNDETWIEELQEREDVIAQAINDLLRSDGRVSVESCVFKLNHVYRSVREESGWKDHARNRIWWLIHKAEARPVIEAAAMTKEQCDAYVRFEAQIDGLVVGLDFDNWSEFCRTFDTIWFRPVAPERTEFPFRPETEELTRRRSTGQRRFARVTGGLAVTLESVRAYMPANYTAEWDEDGILISGIDSHGWTLDRYVIPRLDSGLIVAVEVNPAPLKKP